MKDSCPKRKSYGKRLHQQPGLFAYLVNKITSVIYKTMCSAYILHTKKQNKTKQNKQKQKTRI